MRAWALAAVLLFVAVPSLAHEEPVTPDAGWTLFLHDCNDDYGPHASGRSDQNGHDLVALFVNEGSPAGNPLLLFRIVESAHPVQAPNDPTGNVDADIVRKDVLTFKAGPHRTYSTTLATGNDTGFRYDAGFEPAYISTATTHASGEAGAPRKQYTIGYDYADLRLRTNEVITFAEVTSLEPTVNGFAKGDYMPGGYMDNNRGRYEGGETPFTHGERRLCPGAPESGDPHFDILTSGYKIRQSDLPNGPPVVQFSYNPFDPTAASPVRFLDTTQDPDGDALVNWTWNLGDGSPLRYSQLPLHTYSERGNYTVTLTVTDELGATATRSQPVTVRNSLPVIRQVETTPQSPLIGENVQFRHFSTDADGQVVATEWDFGDGNQSAETNPVHRYTKAALYTLTLTVRDNHGGIAKSTHPVHVRSDASEPALVAPDASFTFSPQNPKPGETIQFTDTSVDQDGTISSWKWTFGDALQSTAANPTHAYAVPGVYTVGLIVTDNTGLESARATANINVVAPSETDDVPDQATDVPISDFDWEPLRPRIGQPVLFTDQSEARTGQIDLWRWTFGDGGKSGIQDPSHTYEQPGKYRITLTVRDTSGNFATTVQFIEVTAPAGIQGSPSEPAPGPGIAAILGVAALMGAVLRRQRA